MQRFHEIILILHNKKENEKFLNYQETLELLNCIIPICSDKSIIHKILHILALVNKSNSKIENLSIRESEVFKLIGIGFSTQEISKKLTISLETVSTHRKHIIKKLKLSGAGQLQKISCQYLQNQL